MSGFPALFSLWLHVMALAVWIGGMAFFVLALMPLARAPEYRAVAPALIERIGLRFRPAAWIALGVLVLSGIANLRLLGVSPSALVHAPFWQSPPGRVLGLKLLLVAVILVLSALHDFRIGPRSMVLARRGESAGEEARRLRRQAAWIGRVNFILALAVVALGLMLGHGIY